MKIALSCWVLFWSSLSLCLAQQAGAPVLALDDAVRIAVANNRQVQASVLDIGKANEATAEAKTLRFPQLSTYLLGGTALNSINFTVPLGVFGVYPGIGPVPAQDSAIKTPRRLTGLIYGSVSQPLSQLYKIGLGIRESRLGEDLARQNVRQQKQQTAQQVRQAYYQIVQTQNQISSGETTLKYLTELAALTDRRLAEEAVLKSDGLTVRAKLSQQRYQLLTLRDGLATQKEALNRLLGRDLETGFSVEVQPLPSAEELDLAVAQKKAIEQRPEIRKARLQVSKAGLDIRRQRAEYIPDLSVQVSYLSLANINLAPPSIAHAGFLLQWQPFDWGQKRHRIEQLRATEKQAELTTKDAEEQVVLEVHARYRALLEARALLDTQAASQEAEREKLRVLMNRYEQKAALLADILQQQSALAQADNQYQQAVASFWTAKADFDRALGEE